MDFNEYTSNGTNKVDRYKWFQADVPGRLEWINKTRLLVDHSHYQRPLIEERVAKYTREWSWLACGVLTVARRGPEYYLIDGQHRHKSSLRRSDISDLPCLVFDSRTIQEEARGFIAANKERKAVTAKELHKARLTAGDPVAIFIQSEIERLGLSVTSDAKTAGHFASLRWAADTATDDRETFAAVLDTVAAISLRDGEPIRQMLCSGFTYIHKNHPGGILEKRIAERIRSKNTLELCASAKKSEILLNAGGSRNWARGIIDALNKGLTRKFRVKGISES